MGTSQAPRPFVNRRERVPDFFVFAANKDHHHGFKAGRIGYDFSDNARIRQRPELVIATFQIIPNRLFREPPFGLFNQPV
jgi:hypothetical protein